MVKNVAVYCASSTKCAGRFFDAARKLGAILATEGIGIVYGGGRAGLMGALADSALESGGKVVGVIPGFMRELEWQHRSLTELKMVETLHERKQLMLEEADAVIAMPGGTGTLDELIEAITWKRLGIHTKPVVILNTNGFFNPLLEQLRQCVSENFMHPRHADMWVATDTPEEVLTAIRKSKPWDTGNRSFAAV